MVQIKGHEFKQITIRDSYNRRALKCKNNIINYLKVFGLTEDDIEIPLEKITMRKAQATAAWYMWDEHLFFSYNGAAKFVENLAMIEQVIKYFIQQVAEEQITPTKFLELFAEEIDIVEQRKNARTVLGVDENSIDFETMHKNYRKMSKEYHPDMPTGDVDRFKEINTAHKILKKELCLTPSKRAEYISE